MAIQCDKDGKEGKCYVGDHTAETGCHDGWGRSTWVHPHSHDKQEQQVLFRCFPVALSQSLLNFQRDKELNSHTGTGLFFRLPFRMLLRIISINMFALMR